MSVAKQLKKSLRRKLSLLHRDRPALLIFLFHALFKDQDEISLNHVDPQQRITLDHMREFIAYFKGAGYKFISPDELYTGMDDNSRYVLITFDDGYYNNMRMVPLLEEAQVPALFFITTGNIENKECFWWDVVHRERHREGVDRATISREQKSLKKLHHKEILDRLHTSFGADCLKPWSDTDRPMTVSELQEFAQHPLVHIGNHTSSHYILDNYDTDEVEEQIREGQEGLIRLLDQSPSIIAYPNGNYSQAAIESTKRTGLKSAISLDKHKNYLPIDWSSDDAYKLGRFTLWGTEDIAAQCDIFRSDLRI